MKNDFEKNLETEESRAFWKFIKKAQREVNKWPCWMRRSGIGADNPPCKDLSCRTCYDDKTARELLEKKVKRLERKLKKLSGGG